MAGRFVVLRAAGKSSDSLPGCSTFAGWWCDMNIMPKISKVSFIWQPLLSCCAIYEMASRLSGHIYFAIIVAFVVFPQVYKRIILNPDTPLIVVLAGIFSSALGW